MLQNQTNGWLVTFLTHLDTKIRIAFAWNRTQHLSKKKTKQPQQLDSSIGVVTIMEFFFEGLCDNAFVEGHCFDDPVRIRSIGSISSQVAVKRSSSFSALVEKWSEALGPKQQGR